MISSHATERESLNERRGGGGGREERRQGGQEGGTKGQREVRLGVIKRGRVR